MLKLFVPGRLCLFGEHSDWAGFHRVINSAIVPGAAIVTGIEQGIYAEVEKADNFSMRCTEPAMQGKWTDFTCAMNLKSLRETASAGGYFSYVCGVASYIKEHYNVGGLAITVTKMDLPEKAGLSSSAAVCVLVTRAFNQLYNLNMNTMGEMNSAFKGEQRTPSRCGRLDQACAFGVRPVCMHFDGEDVSVDRLVVKKPLYWVFAGLNAEKDTVQILADLNKCYPFAQNEKEKNVHKALGEKNQDIIARAIACMRNGEAEALGALMTEAQQLFDALVAPASPVQLASPKLHRFLNDKTIKALTYGGKGVGSQGDGSIQFLAKDAESREKLVKYLSDNNLAVHTLTIEPRRLIRKAIIPVAGFGTRLYPATRTVKKDMLPVIDSDGMLKPAILVLLEELNKAGIEEVCLVVGSEEEWETYRKYFQLPLPPEHREKLSEEQLRYENKIFEIGKKLTYRIQSERRGFGHAVFQCRDFTEGEPVILLLGDTLYTSNQENCSAQLMNLYDEIAADGRDKPLVAVHTIPLKNAPSYGVLCGSWTNSERNVMKVRSFVEKPEPKYAEDNLLTDGKCYGVFGQYVLTPDVFTNLGAAIENQKTETGEIGLTETLAGFIDTGLNAAVIDGEQYDIGNVAAYKKTISSMGGLL
jgi:UTP-glucose-1-phosphate uridylyltransferase/mevalonate kinase